MNAQRASGASACQCKELQELRHPSGHPGRTKNRSRFWCSFRGGFNTNINSKIALKKPKVYSKSIAKIIDFFTYLFRGFGTLQALIGSLLALPKALLVSLWTPKTWKSILFFKSPFRCFAALDGSPGAILACPGLIWDPKRTPKGTQKLSKNFSKIDSKKCPEKDPKMTSKWSPKSISLGELLGHLAGPFGDDFRDLGQESSRWRRGGPRGCQDGPRQGYIRWLQEGAPGWFREGPKEAHPRATASKTAQHRAAQSNRF